MSRNTLLEDMEDQILARREKRLDTAEDLMKLGLLFGLAFLGFLPFDAMAAFICAGVSVLLLVLALCFVYNAKE